jgi:hypothetical protein
LPFPTPRAASASTTAIPSSSSTPSLPGQFEFFCEPPAKSANS